MTHLSQASATSWAQNILEKMGARPDHADQVAQHLVQANLAGHDSHGLVRLPQYAQEVEKGLIDLQAEPALIIDAGSLAIFDARRAWGPVAAGLATQECGQRARALGLAAVGLRNAPHIGRVGAYPETLARQGLIAQAWCNCSGAARVAPWGGTQPKLATNPIALAFPTQGEEPLLADITTSVVAEGKVRIARNAGKELPPGWIRDQHGEPSTRPADLYEGGTILPLGGEAFGHKGSALAIFCDLLAGVLIGSGCGLMPGTQMGNGLLLLAIDPTQLGDPADIQQRVAAYVDYLRSTPKQAGVEEILLPGEPEQRSRQTRLTKGIPIDVGTWKQLQELSERMGVWVPTE